MLGDMRAAKFMLVLAVALPGVGCTLLDRDSYSLIYKKKAHLYDPPPAAGPEKAPEPDPYVNDYPNVRHDLDQLIAPLVPDLQPFRPFAYCYLHESTHGLESLVAVALTPLEYPVALTGNVAYIAIDAAVKVIKAPLEALLPPPDKPSTIEERQKTPRK